MSMLLLWHWQLYWSAQAGLLGLKNDQIINELYQADLSSQHLMNKLNETYLEVEVWLEFYQASEEQRLHEIQRVRTVGHPLKKSGNIRTHDKEHNITKNSERVNKQRVGL